MKLTLKVQSITSPIYRMENLRKSELKARFQTGQNKILCRQEIGLIKENQVQSSILLWPLMHPPYRPRMVEQPWNGQFQYPMKSFSNLPLKKSVRNGIDRIRIQLSLGCLRVDFQKLLKKISATHQKRVGGNQCTRNN